MTLPPARAHWRASRQCHLAGSLKRGMTMERARALWTPGEPEAFNPSTASFVTHVPFSSRSCRRATGRRQALPGSLPLGLPGPPP
jgi:hypothetical protein